MNFKQEIDKHVKALAKLARKNRPTLCKEDAYGIAYQGFRELMKHETVLMKAKYLPRTYSSEECEAVINAAVQLQMWRERGV